MKLSNGPCLVLYIQIRRCINKIFLRVPCLTMRRQQMFGLCNTIFVLVAEYWLVSTMTYIGLAKTKLPLVRFHHHGTLYLNPRNQNRDSSRAIMLIKRTFTCTAFARSSKARDFSHARAGRPRLHPCPSAMDLALDHPGLDQLRCSW